VKEGWEGFSFKIFRQIFIIPEISPYPSLKKRGEFFITFPSPSQGEGGGGVIQKSPSCVPLFKEGEE